MANAKKPTLPPTGQGFWQQVIGMFGVIGMLPDNGILLSQVASSGPFCGVLTTWHGSCIQAEENFYPDPTPFTEVDSLGFEYPRPLLLPLQLRDKHCFPDRTSPGLHKQCRFLCYTTTPGQSASCR